MCIGIPCEVLASDATAATVCGRDGVREVSTLLTGPVAPGQHVLVHNTIAVRVLDEAEAQLIALALDGAEAALAGGNVDAFFPDLADREPELPPHLRALAASA